MKNRFIRRSLFATVILAAIAPGISFAKCNITGKGDINIIGNSFPVLQYISREMEGCNKPGLKITFKITPQVRQETEQAFASKGKSPFDAAVVSMDVYANLQSRGQLQSMTDLVNKYRTKYKIEDSMLVSVNGEVMAVAFMQNAQNLYYRKDIFDRLGLKPPTNYDEMVQTAAVIKSKESSIEFPIAQTFAKGIDSSMEFVNIFVGHNGKMFKAGSAQPAFNDAAGVKAIETMKSMLPFMTPNVLASNSDDVMNQFQQGKAAMGVLWGSRAARMDDAAASKVVGKMDFVAAPAAMPGGKSATHLWWDGVVMPKNIAADRDTVFQVLMESLSEETLKSGNDTAIWIRSAYKPTRFGAGVVASAKAGAPIWPSVPYLSLALGEIGKVLPDALTGKISSKEALDAAAAAYVRSATEKGFLK